MGPEEEAVVIPLVRLDVEPGTDAMLRMLLNREAIVLSRVSAPVAGIPSEMVAQTSGAFAKAIGQAVSQIGHHAPSSDGLYRLILPSGSVARDLIPAVGGGFRGMVRAGGSRSISGHARLVPATAGAGAAVAAGPLIATVALAVAGEMLTQHQMNKKLDSIKVAVHGVQRHLDREDRAVLTSAGKAARTVAGYLLDQARLPDFSSASHAFGELAQLTSEQVERLDGWLEVVAKHEGADQVNGPQLMTALVGKRDDQIEEFERSVAQTYEALALSARVVVLEKIAAEFANPGLSLPHVEHVLRDELSALSHRQNQLVGLLDDLSAMQIDGGRLPNPVAVKRILSTRTSFGRLARALHSAPEGLPLLTESDQIVLELKPTQKGLSVITPATT